jgi:hypothetical protein
MGQEHHMNNTTNSNTNIEFSKIEAGEYLATRVFKTEEIIEWVLKNAEIGCRTPSGTDYGYAYEYQECETSVYVDLYPHVVRVYSRGVETIHKFDTFLQLVAWLVKNHSKDKEWAVVKDNQIVGLFAHSGDAEWAAELKRGIVLKHHPKLQEELDALEESDD